MEAVPFSRFHDAGIRETRFRCGREMGGVQGLGKSFGLNRMEGPEETISAAALVALLADIVAKNGNLLLDVGPEPDGTIPAIQVDRLHQLGVWLEQNGDAIFDTRPWTRATGKTADGIDVRFTAKDNALYAVLLGNPKGIASPCSTWVHPGIIGRHCWDRMAALGRRRKATIFG